MVVSRVRAPPAETSAPLGGWGTFGQSSDGTSAPQSGWGIVRQSSAGSNAPAGGWVTVGQRSAGTNLSSAGTNVPQGDWVTTGESSVGTSAPADDTVSDSDNSAHGRPYAITSYSIIIQSTANMLFCYTFHMCMNPV